MFALHIVIAEPGTHTALESDLTRLFGRPFAHDEHNVLYNRAPSYRQRELNRLTKARGFIIALHSAKYGDRVTLEDGRAFVCSDDRWLTRPTA